MNAMLHGLYYLFESFLMTPLQHIGRYIIFCSSIIKHWLFPPLKRHLLFQQLEFIGLKSLNIIILASIMIGSVFGIQFGSIFRIFGVESLIGAAASFSLSKELGPVISSFLVASRAGSAMTAEIANMKVNEQIDTLKILAVNPIGYLASPRVLASMIMMPFLNAFFIIFGMLAAYICGVILFNIDTGIFLEKIRWITKADHLVEGMIKTIIFGWLFSSISCYIGFFAKGGAKGVGFATTKAVVLSLVIILVSDFFISYIQMEKVMF